MDSLTGLLADLVSIPSVNPMGRALAGPDLLETRLTGFLEDWLGRNGIACRRQPVTAGRDNLLARFESSGSSRTLLFDVHQDTVPTDGMTIDPFLPRIENGRMWGRGSCDIKGGMAAMLMALRRLCRDRPSGAASVVLACTVDEEFTHTGASQLAQAARITAPSWPSSASRRCSTWFTATKVPCDARSGRGAWPAIARRRIWESTPSTG